MGRDRKRDIETGDEQSVPECRVIIVTKGRAELKDRES